MRVFPIFRTTIIGISITPLAIAHFRWGWDSNPWVPLMLDYLFEPQNKNLPMFILSPTKPPDSLSGFKTSANRSMRFCRKPILRTRNAMVNTEYHTSFRWETMYGYICRKSSLQDHIRISTHFAMGLTLLPRLWVAVILSSTRHASLVCTQCSMCNSSDHIFHHY
jgi:hypothetical protein